MDGAAALGSIVGGGASRRRSWAVLGLFALNTALLLFSHLGTSGVLVSNLSTLTGRVLASETAPWPIASSSSPGGGLAAAGAASAAPAAQAARGAARRLDAAAEDAAALAAACGELREVYSIQFVDAVRKAWSGGARWLAVLLALCSGVWPYVKNVLLLVVWFRPLRYSQRGQLLQWLARLGKWSFLDVFIMVLLNATLRVDMALSSKLRLEVAAFPRAGVFAFCVAAVLSLAQSEWMRQQHADALRSASAASGFPQVLSAGAGAARSRGLGLGLGDKSGGRLRSGWRVSLGNRLAATRQLNERSSLQVRLLLPALCVSALVVGCYVFEAVELTLGGTLAQIPGGGASVRYTVDQVMRSVLFDTEGRCVDPGGSVAGRALLFASVFLTVLTVPTVLCLATGLLWTVHSRSAALESRLLRPLACLLGLNAATYRQHPGVALALGARLAVTADLCSAFACVDVFVFALLLVAAEMDKVVHAVGQASHVQGVSVDMSASLRPGAYALLIAALLLWATELFTTSEEGEPGASELQALGEAAGGVLPISSLELDENGLYDGDLFDADLEDDEHLPLALGRV
jgi:hypothetical protein